MIHGRNSSHHSERESFSSLSRNHNTNDESILGGYSALTRAVKGAMYGRKSIKNNTDAAKEPDLTSA